MDTPTPRAALPPGRTAPLLTALNDLANAPAHVLGHIVVGAASLALEATVPATVDAVAAHLLFTGHRGEPHRMGNCPVARYLTAVLDLPDGVVLVDGHVADIVTRDDGTIRAELPPTVAGFVSAFDRGAYPQLVG